MTMMCLILAIDEVSAASESGHNPPAISNAANACTMQRIEIMSRCRLEVPWRPRTENWMAESAWHRCMLGKEAHGVIVRFRTLPSSWVGDDLLQLCNDPGTVVRTGQST